VNATGSNAVIISKPAGTVAGNVLVASLALNGSLVTSAPAGWVQITAITSIPNPRLYAYYRVADASEPATYTWTLSAAVAHSGGIARYTGVSNTNPIENGPNTAASAANTSSLAVGGVTTVNPSAMLIGGAAINSSSTTISITAPGGMSERWDLGGKRHEFADAIQDSPGNDGIKTWTFSSARPAAAWLAALRPAP
jgi:hypothetical protein